jgi:hypothetical protein
MWYAPNDTNKIPKVEDQKGPNGLLLTILAKKIVRKIMFSKGNYRIYDSDVDAYTKKILAQLQSSYGDLEKIRYRISNSELAPYIERIAKQTIK